MCRQISSILQPIKAIPKAIKSADVLASLEYALRAEDAAHPSDVLSS